MKDYSLGNLRREAASLGKPQWSAMLCYVAELHEKSTHAPRSPFAFPWEEIGPGYVSSPAFGHWDIVHQILDVLPAEPEHARHQIRNNLVSQQPDGFLPGTIWLQSGEPKWDTQSGHPPVWPVAVDEWTQHTGSEELIAECFEPLLRHIGWFEKHRAATPDGFFYTDILNRLWESGVDEGIRFHAAQPGAFACVDATAHVFQLLERAAAWAIILGRESDAWHERADNLRQFMQSELFDEETGWFHDIWAMRETGQRRWALEGMWPFVVGAATPEQAARVIENLLDSERFFADHPLCTVARSEPLFEMRMWRGPAWNSMTLWAARGCRLYGRDDAANILMEKALDASAQQFARTGKIWEFYHPFGDDPQTVQRKPDTPHNAPFPDYLGHNPLIAMARLFEATKT